MENNLKNIIILKNLPSNIIEEAIVVIKENKMAQNLEYIDKQKEHCFNNKQSANKYVVKEAELLLQDYISKIEIEKKYKTNINLNKKNKKLQILSIMLGILLIISLILK